MSTTVTSSATTKWEPRTSSSGTQSTQTTYLGTTRHPVSFTPSSHSLAFSFSSTGVGSTHPVSSTVKRISTGAVSESKTFSSETGFTSQRMHVTPKLPLKAQMKVSSVSREASTK